MIDGIDWGTGAPLTDKTWYGGPYTLIEDYKPPEVDSNDVL